MLSRSRLLPLLLVLLVAVGAALPAVALAGPYTAECTTRLEEEGAIEGGPENPEWAVQLEACEGEAAEHHAEEEHGEGGIDPAPDMEAFTAGLEVEIFAVLFCISAVLVLNWIIKQMRGAV